VDDGVAGGAAMAEGEVEVLELDLDPEHLRREHAQCLVQELLPGLVAFEHRHAKGRRRPPDL